MPRMHIGQDGPEGRRFLLAKLLATIHTKNEEDANCDEFGPTTYFLLASTGIALAIVMVTLIMNVYSLVETLRVKSERRFSSITISILMATLTSVVFSITIDLIIHGSYTFPRTHSVVQNADPFFPERLVRQKESTEASAFLLYFSFIIFTVNLLFISGVWIGVAVSFEKLTLRQGKWFERLCIAYLVFATAVLMPLTAQTELWTAGRMIVFVITFLLGIFFLYTGYRMRLVIQAQSSQFASSKIESAEAPVASSKQSHGMSEMTRILTKIYHTAILMGVLSLSAVICFAIYSVGPLWRYQYIPPGMLSKAGREVAFRIGSIIFAIINLVVGEYLFWTVRGKVKARRIRDAQRSISADDRNDQNNTAVTAHNDAMRSSAPN